MGRMGHMSVDAALVYQHAPRPVTWAIADSIDAMIAALNSDAGSRSGHVEGTATG
jgi:hypothetical protein